MISKKTVRKFTTSVIKIHIDKPELKKTPQVLQTRVTLVHPVTHKVVVIPNIKVQQLVNNVIVGQGPNVRTPVYPGGRSTVTLKVIVTVPNVGSRTKEIVMPVQNGSE